MNIKEIGNAIRVRRKELGLSQQEVAAQLGMGRSTISLLESGSLRGFRLHQLLRIFMVLKLDISIAPIQIPSWEEQMRNNAESEARDLAEASRAVEQRLGRLEKPGRPKK